MNGGEYEKMRKMEREVGKVSMHARWEEDVGGREGERRIIYVVYSIV